MTQHTNRLTVAVNGQPVPLDNCGWIQRHPLRLHRRRLSALTLPV